MKRIRWWNRLAAWLWEPITGPLVSLALPVWEEEAEAEMMEEEREAEKRSTRARLPDPSEGGVPF